MHQRPCNFLEFCLLHDRFADFSLNILRVPRATSAPSAFSNELAIVVVLWPNPCRRLQPSSHSLMQLGCRGPRQVGADEEGVEIVVADGARGAPRGKLAARNDFADPRGDVIFAPGRQKIDRGADPELAELILAQIEAGPAPRRPAARS